MYATQKLAAITASITTRAAIVTQAQQATSENIYTLERIINNTLPLACRQVEEYEDYVGEPMPSHLLDTLRVEITGWERLQESLADYRAADPNEHDAVTYAKNVRQFLAVQRDLLLLSQEIVTSCLVQEHRNTLAALQTAAGTIPL